MSFILGISKPLSFENMAQMTSTVVAHNLGPHHAQSRIGPLSNRAWHGVPECGPSTSRVKLVISLVQRRVAANACVCALGRVVFVVFA